MFSALSMLSKVAFNVAKSDVQGWFSVAIRALWVTLVEVVQLMKANRS